MIWELLATLIAGVGAAGIALLLKKVSPTLFPRYLVPAFAGIGMLTFQVHGEYSWYAHQQSLLPKGVEVVRTIEGTSWWRPWSFLVPHTLQFVALDTNQLAAHEQNSELQLIDLYFFAYREPARMLKQVIHCQQQKRILYSDTLVLPKAGEPLNDQWQPLSSDDPVLRLSCSGT